MPTLPLSQFNQMMDLKDIVRENEQEYEELLFSIEAGVGTFNLLIAVCDDNNYRDRLISQYESELAPDIRSYRITLARGELSLKTALTELVNQEEYLQNGGKAVITVTGAEKLHFLKLGEERSEQEIFSGYLQWTREGLRHFPYPLVIWITHQIENLLVYKAPDFWSWRKGLFRFVSKKTTAVPQELFTALGLEFEQEFPSNYNDNPSLLPLQDLQGLIEQFEEKEGKKSPSLITLYESMGRIYKSRAKEGEAQDYQEERNRGMEYFQKAVNLRKELGRKNGLEYTLSNLASLYQSRGNYTTAEQLYQESLELRKKFFGESANLEIAAAIIDLGGVYHNQGRYEEAISLYEEALAMQDQLLGEESPAIATTFNYLAGTYHAQEEGEKAEQFYRDALALRERVLGEKHPDVANSLSNLGLLYYEQGRYSEAEPLLYQSLELKRKLLLGEEHPDIATMYNNLGLLAYAQGNYNTAEAHLTTALTLRQTILTENHPDIAISLNNLGGLAKAQGNLERAKTHYQQALQISEEKLGTDHPISVKIRDNLTNV